MSGTQGVVGKVEDEAAGWVARLQRERLDERDGLAFDAWLAASSENEAAYRKALSLWLELGDKTQEVLSALAETPAAPTDRWDHR